jgi:hypothetical protein
MLELKLHARPCSPPEDRSMGISGRLLHSLLQMIVIGDVRDTL